MNIAVGNGFITHCKRFVCCYAVFAELESVQVGNTCHPIDNQTILDVSERGVFSQKICSVLSHELGVSPLYSAISFGLTDVLICELDHFLGIVRESEVRIQLLLFEQLHL